MLRGYIGPIGDDFPAIFPLALGLMVFFAAISMTYSTYDDKSDNADLMRANIMISRSVRQQIRFDEDSWADSCRAMKKVQVNYGVQSAMHIVLTEFKPQYIGVYQQSSPHDPDNDVEVGDEPWEFYDKANCGSTGDEAICYPEEWDGLSCEGFECIPENTRVITMAYPVIVDFCLPAAGSDPWVMKSAVLVVSTWR